MIRYKKNIIKLLSKQGITTYIIRKHKIFTESQLQKLRNGELLTQKSLDKLCSLLNCQPGDILEHIPDDDNMNFVREVFVYTTNKHNKDRKG